MIQFAQLVSEEKIVVTLSQDLSWFDIHALLPIKDSLARNFYAEMCRIERWDVRTLHKRKGAFGEYRTQLPPLPLLRARLHHAIEHARESAARRLPAAEGQP